MRSTVVFFSLMLVAPLAHASEGTALSSSGSRSSEPGKYELSLSLGTSQAYGEVGQGQDNRNDLGAGLDLELTRDLGSGLRGGLYGTFAGHRAFAMEGQTFSGSLGLELSYTFATGAAYSPKITAGAGLHGNWVPHNGERETLLGFDVLRLQLGMQSAKVERYALSPVVGVTVATFRLQRHGSATSYEEVVDPGLTAFIFAGLKGDFQGFGG